MDALLVDGDEIELTPDPPWMWVAPVRLSVMALPGHKIKAKGKFAIWETEVVQAGLLAAGKMYTAPGFATPGSVITCTIIVNPATMSQVYKDLKLPVATVATAGTFLATVVPAVNPATGVPDPVIAKTGTWKVVTEKQSVAKSGQPKAAASDGDDADAKGVSASGSNTAQPGAEENKVHWVAVKYQDLEGNPLPEHRVAISTPDGRRVERKTTSAGASRIDGIPTEGEAIARLLEASPRPAVKLPPVPFLGVKIVDEDGMPIEGAGLELTSPSGATLAGESNKKGALRLDKLPELGEWVLSITRVPHGQLPGVGSGSGATSGDTTSGDPATSGGAATGGDGAGTDKPSKRLYLLEVPDVLCRTSSCVIMPEGEPPSAATERPVASVVNLFATAIRLCEERPEFKLLIAAHTDTVDTTADNQVLSNERARMVLAILTGDREAYKKLAHVRHRISDIKQMLRWCVTAHPDVFTCDPGPIDEKDNTWQAVHTFESEFNYFKYYFQASGTPDLELTGSMGPNNWGALFDVLQFGIARELGVLVKEMAPLREKIKWLDDDRKALGFSEHHPIDGLGKDNYESQSNRRVELLFFDENDILPDAAAAESDPANSEIYLPGVYTRERIDATTVGRRTLLVRPHDNSRTPMDNCRVQAFAAGEALAVSASDAGGFHEIALPPACPATVRVVWTDESGVVEHEAELVPSCGTSEGESAQRGRLNNLGYPLQLPFEQAARLFQADYRVDANRDSPLENGLLPMASRAKLDSIFDSCNATLTQDTSRAFDTRDKPPRKGAPAGSKTPSVAQALTNEVWVAFTHPKVDAYYKAVAKYALNTWVKARTRRFVIEVTVIDGELNAATPSPPGRKVKSLEEAWQRAAVAAGKGGKIIWTAHGFGGDGGGRDFGLRLQESEVKLRPDEFPGSDNNFPRKSNKWLLTNADLRDAIVSPNSGGRAKRFSSMFQIAREAIVANQVKVVEFFGCNIGKEPKALARIAKLLQADVIGYLHFSAAADDGSFVQMNTKDDGDGQPVAGTQTKTGTPVDTPKGLKSAKRVKPRPLSERDPEEE